MSEHDPWPPSCSLVSFFPTLLHISVQKSERRKRARIRNSAYAFALIVVDADWLEWSLSPRPFVCRTFVLYRPPPSIDPKMFIPGDTRRPPPFFPFYVHARLSPRHVRGDEDPRRPATTARQSAAARPRTPLTEDGVSWLCSPPRPLSAPPRLLPRLAASRATAAFSAALCDADVLRSTEVN